MNGKGSIPHCQELDPIWKQWWRIEASVEIDVCFVMERGLGGSHLELSSIRYQNVMSMQFYRSWTNEQEFAT